MVMLQHGRSDTEHDPKMPKMKDQVTTLENTVDQLMTLLYEHGEKMEALETELEHDADF